LSETCNVSEAARKAGIGRRTAYEWRDDDAEFQAEWDEAIEVAVDKLEKVAWDRATDPAGGSDHLLLKTLEAHRPEKWRNKQAVELTGKDGGPIKSEIAAVELHGDMTADQAAEAYAKLLG
jgi:hypothetical protein